MQLCLALTVRANRQSQAFLHKGITIVPAVNADCPRLRHCTLVRKSDAEGLLVVIGTEYFEITNELGSVEDFLNVKRYLDGRHTIDEISTATGVSAKDIVALVDSIAELGMLRSGESKARIPSDEFLEQINSSIVMWGQQLGYHRLYAGLERGEFRKEVFLGLLLETYHYVNSASTHISTAISHCTHEPWKKLLSKYLVEEHDHACLVSEALVNAGMPLERVHDAHPLIGTLSLVQMLCEIGRQHTLGYIACTALFEARRDSFNEAKESFEKLAETYGFSRDVVAPIISHMSGDIAAGHKSLVAEALERIESIHVDDAHFIVNQLHDLKHSFDQFHDQIVQYYTDSSNYIPRLKVDYFSL